MLSASSLKRQAAIFKVQSIFLCFYFFFFPRTVFLSTAMQQCRVLLGLFFSGKIWTVQFYWKLDVCNYSAPTQPSLTQNIQVTILTLLGYSIFNIRNALKLLMELSPQKAQENGNRTARDGQDFTEFDFLGGEMEGVSSPARRNSGNTRIIREKQTKTIVAMLYPGKSQSWSQELVGLPHQDQQTTGRFWTEKRFHFSKAALNTHKHTEQTHLYNPGHLRQVQSPCCYIL